MSEAEDHIDDMLDVEMLTGEVGCHGIPISPAVAFENARNDRRLREQRFERFFRTDGRAPEWRTGGTSALYSRGEWMRIDQMEERHIRCILARNGRRPGRGCGLRRIMDLPESVTPAERLGDGFSCCANWNDALILIFSRELERRAALDFDAMEVDES